ncbi:fungal specific transcription factor domain-containing protein [Arthroderma uncinatum]|uniref:fungal specific transcription factor domain-containing protein n=1 Tax=Arthroderma uncinatum TaxID=74035 RepID=UPI00144A977F|nr:fungal specific transcription factor domain-containing protein [Arthroderma uncinatum]KAF3480191.1 fungal specific transcription factor domain-containing protein [Arthroderma uncinatum]
MEVDSSPPPLQRPTNSQADAPDSSYKVISCQACRTGHAKCDGQEPGEFLFSSNMKKKCDGVTPACNPCVKRNLDCQYDYTTPQPRRQTLQVVYRPSPDSSERPSKFPRLSMPNRRTGQEQLVMVAIPPLPRANLRKAPSHMSDDISESEAGVEAQEVSEPTADAGVLPSLGPPAETHKEEQEDQEENRSDSVEFMDIVGHGELNGGGLDPSAWLDELNEAISHRTDVSKPGYSNQAKRELARLAQIRKDNPGLVKVRPDAKDLSLPSRQVTDRLLAAYLTREYVNLPIFHLPAFHTKYTGLWANEGFSDDTGIFHGILNVMFALGCLVTDPNSHVDASMYFIRAQRLIRLGSLEGDSLTTIQAYIIASQYLIAINNFQSAWKSIGVAIRVAETLRLHLGSGSQHFEDRVDRELARRLWHSCILLERTIALNLGTNMIVTPRSFQAPLPTPLENEYVDVIFGGKPLVASERPSIIEFFTVSTRLMERYEDIVAVQEELRPILRHPRKLMETFECQNLLNADRRLCNWLAALPPFLVPGSTHDSLDNPVAKRQHNILRIRYLNIRLLLWRPLLALVAASPDLITSETSQFSNKPHNIHDTVESPLIYSIVYKGACKCIMSAWEIINILITNRQPDGKIDHLAPLPAWWENIGFVFTCALVLLAARLCPGDLHKQLPGGSKSIEDAWKGCIELLSEYRSFNSKAGTYLVAIESLATNVAEIASANIGGTGSEDEASPQQVNDVTWLETLPGDLPCLA